MAFRSLLSHRHHLTSLLSSCRSSGLRRLHATTHTPCRFPRQLATLLPYPRAFFSTDTTDGTAAEEVVLPRQPSPRERTDAQSVNAEVLLPGCDFKHWLVFMEPPKEETPRDEIIDRYVKTLAEVLGSEEEAKMKIYSVSTRHYYAFGALIPQEVSNKLKTLPGVHWVLPDSYLHPKTKDYGGEPFINGKAVPYDPNYHAIWLQNNQKPPERASRRIDRSRNFDRPRDNWQPRDSQGRPPRPPMPNQNREFEKQSVSHTPGQGERL